MWAEWIGHGLDEDVFWRSTYREIGMVLKCRASLQRQANLRAGLIAAVIVNQNRRKGKKAILPTDFFLPVKEHMQPKEAVSFLDGWAKQVNAVATRRGRVKRA